MRTVLLNALLPLLPAGRHCIHGEGHWARVRGIGLRLAFLALAAWLPAALAAGAGPASTPTPAQAPAALQATPTPCPEFGLEGELLPGEPVASAPDVVGSEGLTVRLWAYREDHHWYIRGSFRSRATLEQAWSLLSDYEGVTRVVKSVVRSEVKERTGQELLLEQEMVGRFLLFSKGIRLRLKVKEARPASIEFEEVSGSPFAYYKGAWNVEQACGEVAVHYRLEVTRGAFAPAFIERSLMRKNSLDLLRQMKAELDRRVGPEKDSDGIKR